MTCIEFGFKPRGKPRQSKTLLDEVVPLKWLWTWLNHTWQWAFLLTPASLPRPLKGVTLSSLLSTVCVSVPQPSGWFNVTTSTDLFFFW